MLIHPVHEAADQVLETMLERGDLTEGQFREYASNRAAYFRMMREAGLMSMDWAAEGYFTVRYSEAVFRRLFDE